MRHEKGKITISKTRDIPLLLLIRSARAVRLDQICELLLLAGLEPNRRLAYKRIQRLLKVDLLTRLERLRHLGTTIYSISHTGLSLLESYGHCLLSLGSFSKTIVDEAKAVHMVELNDIRLALARSRRLISWQGELEVLSENLVMYGEILKDYDAVVTVDLGGTRVRFGLEYERTAKSARRYREIRDAIESDHRVDLVLYLTPSQELMYLLTKELEGLRKQLFFGIANSFKANDLKFQVLTYEPGRRLQCFQDVLLAHASTLTPA